MPIGCQATHSPIEQRGYERYYNLVSPILRIVDFYVGRDRNRRLYSGDRIAKYVVDEHSAGNDWQRIRDIADRPFGVATDIVKLKGVTPAVPVLRVCEGNP